MKIVIYLTFFLLFVSCDNSDEVTYENNLILAGNITDTFSKLGEERQLSVTYTSTPVTSDKDVEALLQSSEIVFSSEKGNFTFSDYTISGNRLNFKIICKENKSEQVVEDKIHIRIANSRFNQEISEDLTQAGADIHYAYKVETNITGSYTLPAEGGVFNIPVQGKRLTYINDNLASEEPYSLKGLHFVSNNANTAWVHSTSFVFGKSPGEYVIQLTAKPYNFEGEYLWTVAFRYDEETLYHLQIFHPQTPGEDYFMPYTKTIYEKIFIDE